jgi:hypothetical protein
VEVVVSVAARLAVRLLIAALHWALGVGTGCCPPQHAVLYSAF